MNKFEQISKVLGREITSKNIGAVTAEEWQKVEGSVKPASNTDEPATTDNQEETSGLTAEQVQSIVTTSITSALAPIVSRIESLEGSPAEDPAPKPTVDGGEKPKVHSWEDPNDPIAQLAKKQLED